MKPVLPLAILIPLLLVIVVGGLWLSWKSSSGAHQKLRKILAGLRLGALVALAIILLNPGKWEALKNEAVKVWVCLVDDSKSMAIQSDPSQRETRSEEAAKHLQTVRKSAKEAGLPSKAFRFDEALEELGDRPLSSSGDASDLSAAGEALLTQMTSQGERLGGVVVLSDGRQTDSSAFDQLTLRAQALGVPFHAVPIGGRHASRDLAVSIPRKTVTVFPKQSVQIAAALRSENLDPFETEVTLKDETGKILATQTVRVGPDEPTLVSFSIETPESSTSMKVSAPLQESEMRSSNNDSQVHIRVLTEKARIFLAEGAPYWDSKFLAQLLRQQEFMDVHSVHRLSDERWFRIDSGESKPHQSGVDVFPDTLEKLQAYDLIIFGKNSEHFITPERAANLRAFVKNQGGAVLFARAKPYSGRLPELEPLEPVEWANGLNDDFNLIPSADGQAAGLFGEALPKPDSAIWKSLPALKDAHRIDVIKPFTRILAHGQSAQEKFPLLMVRRYGQGVSGLVNADGLWKWDFYPEARELGNMYHEYWIQMIYWMLSYSEFLPGQDYSLNLSSNSVQQGSPVAIRMEYRGEGTPANLTLEISSPNLSEPLTISPATAPRSDGRLKWTSSFTPDSPGNYRFKLIQADGGSMPETTLTVLAPPTEMDELSADLGFLERLTSATGGQIIAPEELTAFLEKALVPGEIEDRDSGVVWSPYWMRWIFPLLLVLFLATEWFLRRRNGLI